MRVLADQDVYATTTRFPRAHGHDVVTASEIGPAKASDEAVLAAASSQQRILVTRDRHFGALVFLKRLGSGVLYLRMTPRDLEGVHAELEHCLGMYSQEDLARAFVTVEPARHRFRRIPR